MDRTIEPTPDSDPRPPPTSTSWSSAPASPASTSSTVAREAGFSVRLLEAGDGVGGTWYWNRYPGCPVRLGELHLRLPVLEGAVRRVGVAGALRRAAGDRALPQPRGGPVRPAPPHALRRQGHFGRLRRGVGHAGRWSADDGTEVRARFLIAATGVLSVPYYPDVPGREDFRGESYHTGLWPADAGRLRRQAGRGHRHRLERRADHPVHRRRGRLADRVPAHRQLVHPAQQRARSRPRSRRSCGPDFEAMREVLNTSVPGSSTRRHDRAAFDDSEDERRAFFETMWNSPGFAKLTSNYTDLLFDRDGQRRVVRVHRRQDPQHRRRIPRRRSKLDPEGPPLRREAAAVRDRLLRDVQQSRTWRSSTSARRRSCGSTETGIETTEGVREFDIIVWATGFDFGTGALAAHGHPRAATAWRSTDHWADGPKTFLGVQTPASRTSSSPAARTPRPATTRATTATRSTSSPTRSTLRARPRLRRHRGGSGGRGRSGPPWSTGAPARRPSARAATSSAPTSRASRGKYLLNSGGRPKLFEDDRRGRGERLQAGSVHRLGHGRLPSDGRDRRQRVSPRFRAAAAAVR